jgi:hypothetical protein
MGKGRDKRRRSAKKNNQQTRDATREIAKPSSDPSVLGESDAPVPAPLKPKPHLRSGAIAIPEPEPEDDFVELNPKAVSK